jgi:phage-related holin
MTTLPLILNTNPDPLMISYWNSITSVFTSVQNYFTSKVVVGGIIVVYSFFFNISFANVMSALVALVVFDMITAVAGAKVRGELIESRKMAKSAFKLMVYGLVVSAGHLTDLAMGLSSFAFNLEIGLIGFWAATEMISTLENVGKMGYATPAKLINALRGYATAAAPAVTSDTHTEITHVSDMHTEASHPVV